MMTNYPFEEIEQKEFNLKFSFEMLTSTIMFSQKVQSTRRQLILLSVPGISYSVP